MRFAWDEAKDRANRAKHGVGFEAARMVFDDPLHLSVQDRVEGGEARWQTFGLVGRTALVVAHTYEDRDGLETVRIISARRMTKAERRRYETAP